MENVVPPPSPPAADTAKRVSPIAGFWRRVLAAVIDFCLLGAFGWILGLFFSQQFMHMGGWGRLLGFVIALLYFAPLNSRIGRGQTLGKRTLRIRVTTVDGEGLGLARSCLRYFVLAVPYFLNGAAIPFQLLKSPLGILLSLGTFGLGLSILYLFVFNTRTRQSLHDLAVGSYVVRTGSEGEPKPRMWRGHYLVVGVILLVSAILPAFLSRLAQVQIFAQIMPAYEAVLDEPEVTTAQVVSGQNYFWGGDAGRGSVSVITAVIRLNRSISDQETEAKKFARIILRKDAAASKSDYLSVELLEGYDIGIASALVGHTFKYTPAEWRQQLESSGAPRLMPTPSPAP